MAATVIDFPKRGDTIVTKKQLAAHLKRSVRWVELKVRDEGLPIMEATDRYGRRRYSLQAVESWLRGGRPKPVKRLDRLAALEARMASLEAEIAQLRDSE